MKKTLLNVLKETFPGIPDVVIKEMLSTCERIHSGYTGSAKLSFSVTPRKIESYKDIVDTAGLIGGYDKRYQSDAGTKNKLFAEPRNTKPVELTLVYVGGTAFSGVKGYEVVKDAHPSLLIDAMKVLTKEKLATLGMPHFATRIVLPTSEKNAFKNEFGKPCFASMFADGKHRGLSLTNMSASGNVYAMLLRKVS